MDTATSPPLPKLRAAVDNMIAAHALGAFARSDPQYIWLDCIGCRRSCSYLLLGVQGDFSNAMRDFALAGWKPTPDGAHCPRCATQEGGAK